MTDRNLGTYPQPEEVSSTGILGQIRVKYQGDDHQNLITEDTEETGNVDADMLYVQSRMHSDYDSAERTADSDLEDENNPVNKKRKNFSEILVYEIFMNWEM